jgi:rhodanese-related sulfurtransferase
MTMNDFLHKLPEFVGNHLALVALFAGVRVALLVMQLQSLFSRTRELTPAGLTALINRESPLLIDLSAIADFEKMHIPGARHVAMSQFDPENKDLAKAKELPVVVIDRDGRGNAVKAASLLLKAGLTQVHTLTAGTLASHAAQPPVAKRTK